MKTYTFTWKSLSCGVFPRLRRCRLSIYNCHWNLNDGTALENFLYLFRNGVEHTRARELRLTRAGKLIARTATYQGV